jgi:glycosyltransferase involved in cell wall biosynthesis
LLRALSNIQSDCSYVIYVDNPNAKILIPADPRFSIKTLSPKLYPAWEQVSLPLTVFRDQLDVLHCPGNSAPIFLFGCVKLVITIHDVMFMFPASQLPKSPSWYQRIGRIYLKNIVPLVAKRASLIITVSSTSREDILRFVDVPEGRVNVIWSAANEACRIISDASLLDAIRFKFKLTSPFLLTLGALDLRKNTATVIKAFAKYKQQNSDGTKLAVVGLSAHGIDKFRCLAEKLGIGNDVAFAGFVTEEDLIGLYNAAELLIYPSLYEGFGLPVLEAMVCATPVITSPCGSIPEIAGDAALMVDPHDADAIATAIQSVLTDKALYDRLVEKGRLRAGLFSWQLAAEKTFALYQEMMATK